MLLDQAGLLIAQTDDISEPVIGGWWALSGTVVTAAGAVVASILSYLSRREAKVTQMANKTDHGEVKELALQMKAGQDNIAKKIDHQGGSIRRLHDRFDSHLEHHADRESGFGTVDRRGSQRPESPGED